jgi:ParB-like chromosome segregation protein Spo0J
MPKRAAGTASSSPPVQPTRRLTSAQAAEELFEDLFSTQGDASRDNGPPRDRDVVMLDRELLDPNPFQPRKYFAPEGIALLGRSMREVGQLQPIVVRPHPTRRGRYQIVAGERRWRASAREHGDVPILRASLRQLSDYEVARISIEENEKREDVSPIARARGLANLYRVSPGTPELGDAAAGVPGSVPGGVPTAISAGAPVGVPGDTDGEPRHKPRWEDVAASVGLTKRSALRLVELLQLPEKIQDRIEELRLTEKHGRALLLLKASEHEQQVLLEEIQREELSGNQALRRADELRGARHDLIPDQERPQVPGRSAEASAEGTGEASRSKAARRAEASSAEPGLAVALAAALKCLQPALRSVEAARRELQLAPSTGEGQSTAEQRGQQERLLEALSHLKNEVAQAEELLRAMEPKR